MHTVPFKCQVNVTPLCYEVVQHESSTGTVHYDVNRGVMNCFMYAVFYGSMYCNVMAMPNCGESHERNVLFLFKVNALL